MTHQPWPWPEDTREDRIKRVGKSYRDLVRNITQGRCDDPAGDLHRLDMHWHSLGVYWPVPRLAPVDREEWFTAADAAHYCDVQPGTIRKWAKREHIREDHRADGTPIYNVGDLDDLAQRRAQEQRKRTLS